MSRHLLIVHGTWGSRAKWAAPWGPLWRAVCEELPDVRVEQFKWTGRNLHHARLTAATDLADRLRDLSAEDVVIVAHSHGGNVARAASALADEGTGLRRIVAVGTPFICIDLQDDSVFSLGLDTRAPRAIVRVIGAILWRRVRRNQKPTRRYLRRVLPRQPKVALSNSFAWPFKVFDVCAVMWVAASLAARLASTPLREVPLNQLIPMLDPEETHAEIVVLATPADEASLALAFGGFIGFLSLRASRLIVSRTQTDIGWVFCWQLAHWLSQKVLGRRAPAWIVNAPAYMFELAEASVAVPLLVHLIDRVSTGWDGTGISGRIWDEHPEADDVDDGDFQFTRVTVAPTPRGKYTVHMIPLTSSSAQPPFAHSALLGDAARIDVLVDIVATQFRGRSRA